MFFNNLFVEKQAEMRGYFGLAPMLFCFIVPAITMRLLAEEKGGTIELLITMPVRDWEVVVGKCLAAMALLLAILLGLTLVFAVTVAKLGPVDKGPASAATWACC